MSKNNFKEILEQIKIKYRKYRSHNIFKKSMITGIILFNLNLLLNILQFYFLNWKYTWIVYLLLIPLTAALIGYFWPVSTKHIIQQTDKKLQLKEKLITYYEYNKMKKENPFIGLLKKDVIEKIQQKKHTLFKRGWLPEVKYMGIISIITVLIFLGGIGNLVYFPLQEDDSTLSSVINDFKEIESSQAKINPLTSDRIESFDTLREFSEFDLSEYENIEERQIDNYLSGVNYTSVAEYEDSESKYNRSDLEFGDYDQDEFNERDSISNKGQNQDKESFEDVNGENGNGQQQDQYHEEYHSQYSDFSGVEDYLYRSTDSENSEDTDIDRDFLFSLDRQAGDFPDPVGEEEVQEDIDQEYYQTIYSGIKSEEGPYIKASLEELFKADREGEPPPEQNFNYRKEILNQLEYLEIPVLYRDFINDYFSLIIDIRK